MTSTPAMAPNDEPPAGSGRRVRGLDADQRRAQRRDDLLTAALSLFGDKGYPNVSIEQICQTAYVGTRSFYDLFDSKEACYLALFEQLATELERQMQDALRAAPGSEVGGMDRLLDAFARTLVQDPRVPKVVFGQSAAVSPAVERQRRANRRWAAAFVESVWAQYGVGSTGVDVHHIAIGVVGGMFELIADWLHDHDPTRDDDIEALITQLVTFHRVACDGLNG